MSEIVFVMMTIPEDSPYIKYYTQVFDSLHISYDFIIWNRNSVKTVKRTKNVYIFEKESPLTNNSFQKFVDMWSFSQFANRVIKNNKYKRIIVITIQAAIFLSKSLTKLKGNYIIDIRDYSPILKIPFISLHLKRLIHKSFATTISSPGFLDFLPKKDNYFISHNINQELIKPKISNSLKGIKPIKILTIGLLRDFTANKDLILSLANKENFKLEFAGKGIALQALKRLVKNNKINNVVFSGEYKKEDEHIIVERNDIINAFMPDDYNSKLLLSNRLYLSAIYGKPIIVNYNSLQGEFIKKYQIGIPIKNCEGIEEYITNYLEDFEIDSYNKGRWQFIENIHSDIKSFIGMVTSFTEY